jgi:hypothetical protein
MDGNFEHLENHDESMTSTVAGMTILQVTNMPSTLNDQSGTTYGVIQIEHTITLQSSNNQRCQSMQHLQEGHWFEENIMIQRLDLQLDSTDENCDNSARPDFRIDSTLAGMTMLSRFWQHSKT